MWSVAWPTKMTCTFTTLSVHQAFFSPRFENVVAILVWKPVHVWTSYLEAVNTISAVQENNIGGRVCCSEEFLSFTDQIWARNFSAVFFIRISRQRLIQVHKTFENIVVMKVVRHPFPNLQIEDRKLKTLFRTKRDPCNEHTHHHHNHPHHHVNINEGAT